VVTLLPLVWSPVYVGAFHGHACVIIYIKVTTTIKTTPACCVLLCVLQH
jgi:hypothetical protein